VRTSPIDKAIAKADKARSTFAKVANELEASASSLYETSGHLTEAITTLIKERDRANAEASKAEAQAQKVRDFFLI
jgi:hypothetical protein